MAHPFCVHPVMQVSSSDCAIAALSMLTGKPYREVSEAALRVAPGAHEKGLYTTEIVRIASAIDCPILRVPAPVATADEFTGLLILQKTRGRRREHVVMSFEGVVVNPADGLLWNRDTFLTTYHWRITGALEMLP